MTDVSFHTGVLDAVPYACRLLRKAWRSGARVAVFGPAERLARIDAELWRLEQTEFLPHLCLPREGLAPGQLARTPVVLLADGQLPPGERFGVGLSVGHNSALPLASFDRVIELVEGDAPARQAARLRWRAYEQAGATPKPVVAPPVL